mgnify:CR=1 FL=1
MTTLGQWAGVAEERLGVCPGCGSIELTGPTLIGGKFRRFGVPYSACASCGLLFQDPMPVPSKLSEWYAGSGYRTKIGSRLPSPIVIQRQAERAVAAARFILARKKTCLGMAELGGGLGALCSALRAEYDCPTVNVEIDQTYASISRKAGSETADEIPDGPFDLIATLHTVEHLPNPLEVLERMYQVLAPGGHLYVEVPRDEPDVVHTLVFGLESVRKLIGHAGFRVLECLQAQPIADLGTVLICWATKEAT